MGLYSLKHLTGDKVRIKPNVLQARLETGYDNYGNKLWVSMDTWTLRTVYRPDADPRFWRSKQENTKQLTKICKQFRLNIQSTNPRCKYFQKYERPRECPYIK